MDCIYICVCVCAYVCMCVCVNFSLLIIGVIIKEIAQETRIRNPHLTADFTTIRIDSCQDAMHLFIC